VNCVGILNKVAEDNPHLAVYLNSYIPNWFAYRLRATGTKFIHLSTDCVFSGKVGGYAEQSFRDGDTVYDRSKALGEIKNQKDLTFRQSIIGPELRPDGIGLLNWLLMQSGEVKGYKNAHWNGITTLELAKAIEVALSSQLAGIYHLVGSEKVSKNVLLNIMKEAFRKKDVLIQPFDNFPPTDKSLRCTRYDFGYSIPSYQVMMNELAGWVSKHAHLYQHYQIS
jgi:dTDP-4-dehydrorhamnose reductase